MNTNTTPAAVHPEPEHTTWYEVCRWRTPPTISAVRVARETAHQIVLADCAPGNARRAKANTYFRTWDDAHEYLMLLTQSELYAARAALDNAQERYINVKEMRTEALRQAPHER